VPVRIQGTGTDEWRDLPVWPPTTSAQVLHLQTGGGLGDEQAAADAQPATFTYDPADPTPAVGGRLLDRRASGPKDDSVLAERADVLSFSGPPLTAPLDVIGAPFVELSHHSDNPHADLFVRISEVDATGRSRNVTDGFVRLAAADDGDVTVGLDPTAHRFAEGSRIRLLVAGGCFPRFERNLGTGGDPALSTATAPSHRTIRLAGSRLVLPVS
jgi:putative CocE/NonD family hydrolase